MATLELERFLAVVTSLSGDDWEKPTACTLWNVRQIVAHVTGACASYAHWSEFKRQGNSKVQRPYRASGLSFLDSMNQIQVDDRASATSAALIDELQRVGPRAIATRARLPWLLRALRVPLPALGGIIPIGYLTDLIYTRDMWMHRIDLCRATGREMAMTSGHDGRIVALVMRDLEKKLASKLRTTSIVYHLSGSIGSVWQLGAKVSPAATLQLDVLNFNLLASGRLTADEAYTHASIEGDSILARQVLNDTNVPY
ncbi:MAG TPA: maleylpyruvate isomerase family mycothiol-dependent enzyme [Ktedonobacteraceae bacterium]